MALSTTYAAIKTALLTELAEKFPQATHPVEYADYAATIDEYAAAREAAAKLSGRAQESYSVVGTSFNFRDAGGAARVAAALGVRLARAGFSIDAGTPVVHDIRGIHEPAQ